MSTNPFNTAGVQLHVLVDGVPLLEQSAMLISNITVESQLFCLRFVKLNSWIPGRAC